MKKGFTIIELLVVIGILGILMAIMVSAMTGSSDSARATKCLAHLHTLASACHTVAMNDLYYPAAGSFEVKSRASGGKTTYSETKGWISWASMNAYKNAPQSHQSKAGWFISTYDSMVDRRIYALTNGAIWRAISGNASAFVCPQHLKCSGVEPVWSYVMNSAFGWDSSQGTTAKNNGNTGRRRFETMDKVDRTLLLAELPFNADNTAQKCYSETGSGIRLDPTLQYEKDEYIGFNHKDGKNWYAHVCFADGHTEKLVQPSNASEARLRELTKLLCAGKDFAYNGSKYEELK